MKLTLLAIVFLGTVVSAADYFDETKATTLFAFDDVSIPHTQNLKLVMRQPVKHAANPVVRYEPGTWVTG